MGQEEPRAKQSILVIDDEESIRFTLERFLTFEGFTVITAGDCREALDVIKNNNIDVVFADIVLPDGTGMDILSKIKQTQPDCRVIMMTAYPSVETVRSTFLMGASDYITKPIRQQEVMGFVERTYRRNRDAQESVNHC
jgi:two-component system, NtrC family, response regulator HydG